MSDHISSNPLKPLHVDEHTIEECATISGAT
jgi:hypothetical protein